MPRMVLMRPMSVFSLGLLGLICTGEAWMEAEDLTVSKDIQDYHQCQKVLWM